MTTTELSTFSLQSLPMFEGFPYLVVRLAPAYYHFELLPEDRPLGELRDLARLQTSINDLRSCLVLGLSWCFYYNENGEEAASRNAVRGGLIFYSKLHPVRTWKPTPDMLRRHALLVDYAAALNRESGNSLGDVTRGGRPSSPGQLEKLSGNDVPRGLEKCTACGDWRGRCLDPEAPWVEQVVEIYCRCANQNLCARCLKPLYHSKLNANLYDPDDGSIWYVPGFVALSHRCSRIHEQE